MPIVYDGVGGGQGDLFKGMKLWISLRVPQRSTYVDLVKGNGGEVVPLEKQADMLIADNIKRGGVGPPPGSYAFKWITFSVKNRFLQPKEDYLITPAEPRTAGSSVPTKGTRTPFTSKDDLILTKFVLAKEKLSESTQGNEIYKELERRHPNHTWQSWRDRWVRHLSSRPRPNLVDEDAQPEVEVAGSPAPREPPRATPQVQPPRALVPLPSQEGTPRSRGRTFFTPEEDELLLAYIREAQRHNKTAYGAKIRALSGNKIYKEFADRHPAHTWHAWRDRWVRHLSLREDVEDDNIDLQQEQQAANHVKVEPRPLQQTRISGQAASQQPRVSGQAAKPRIPATATKTTAPSGSVKASGAGIAAVRTPAPSSTAKRPNAVSDDQRLERREQARRTARAARLLQRTWRGLAVRRDLAEFETAVVPLQALVRGYLVRMRESERRLQAEDVENQQFQDELDEEVGEQYEDAEENIEDRDLETQGGADALSPRDQFYDDLQDFIEVSGAEVDREPLVDGRKIDLWDLFRAATRQDCSPEDRSWKEVADELGFDWKKSARCLPMLWNCYISNLGEFEEAIKAYDNPEDEEEGDEVDEEDEQQQDSQSLIQTSDAVTAPKEPSAAPSSPVVQSSPPATAVKRSFRHLDPLSSDLGYPSDGSRKRRRLEKRAEIPPTPEAKLGLRERLTSRGDAHGQASPLKGRGATAAQLLEAGTAGAADELLDGDREDFEGADELPVLPQPSKKKFIEPETQDFGFALDGDEDMIESIEPGAIYTIDEDDISPSQQLQAESDDIRSDSPLPGPSGHNAAAATSRHSLAPKPRLAGNSTSRPASSFPGTVARDFNEAAPGPSRSVNGKTAKRTLPPQYQKPSVLAPRGVSAATAISNGTAQPRTASRLSGSIASPRVTASAPQAKRAALSAPAPPNLSSTPPRSSSSRRVPASTAPPLPQNGAQAPSFDNDPAVIDAQFAHFQALRYEKAHIGRALEAATFQRGPMTVALQSLHEGRGLPQREPGVWTDDDDARLKVVRDYDRRGRKGKNAAGGGGAEEERLRATVERYRAALRAKHGEWMKPRMQFMDVLDEGAHA